MHAYDAQDGVLHRGTFYSVGGGFVVTEAEAQSPTALAVGPAIPHPFENAAELLEISPVHGETEQARRSALVVTPDRGGEVLARRR